MHPSVQTKDPLLTAARVVVGLLMGLFAFVGVIVTIGLGAILTVQRSEIIERAPPPPMAARSVIPSSCSPSS